MSAARQVLERLLRRGESALLRRADESGSLPMTRAGAPEYLALGTLDELEQFHAKIAFAEREGAVVAVRDRKGGDGSRLLRLQVADLHKLARHLDMRLLDDRCAEAASQLEAWLPRFPVIAAVLEAWQNNRKLLGGPGAAPELAAAARLIAARADDAGHERILRRESARLFGDSKRIEKLTPCLDVLLGGEPTSSGRLSEELWAEIGLRREPQPLLLSGSGVVDVGDSRVPLLQPYLGLPLESVRAVTTNARYVLTIENLASFHDAASCGGPGLLIYTGGMPSPAWRAAYQRILIGQSAQVPVYHWGDIDEGGFRIAAVLARTADAAGHAVRPWMMSPSSLPEPVLSNAAEPGPAVLAAMCRWADRAGWPDVAADLRTSPILLEQEHLDPRVPT